MNRDAEYKPKSCQYCYFWEKKIGCTFMRHGKESCYYEEYIDESKVVNECKTCPYGNPYPCVGWCTKELLRHFGLLKGGGAS